MHLLNNSLKTQSWLIPILAIVKSFNLELPDEVENSGLPWITTRFWLPLQQEIIYPFWVTLDLKPRDKRFLCKRDWKQNSETTGCHCLTAFWCYKYLQRSERTKNNLQQLWVVAVFSLEKYLIAVQETPFVISTTSSKKTFLLYFQNDVFEISNLFRLAYFSGSL